MVCRRRPLKKLMLGTDWTKELKTKNLSFQRDGEGFMTSKAGPPSEIVQELVVAALPVEVIIAQGG